MSTGKVLLGVLAGIAAGATLGVLLAPDSGSATRKKISKKSEDYVDELTDKFNEVIQGMTKQFKTVKEKATLLVENGKVKADDVLDEVIAASKKPA